MSGIEPLPRLAASDFKQVIRHAPLFSIDLLVKNPDGRFLLGLRTNAPARGYWFVPGGRVYKNEPLAAAFERISRTELGVSASLTTGSLIGLYEHFYEDNVFSAEFGTHYIAAAYSLNVDGLDSLPGRQHSDYRWASREEIFRDATVHPYTRDYFLNA